jgi:hypothetical protein
VPLHYHVGLLLHGSDQDQVCLLVSFIPPYQYTTLSFVMALFMIVQAGKLVGRSSDPQLIGQLAYLAGTYLLSVCPCICARESLNYMPPFTIATHDARIQRVDKVLSYHYGVREMVEVDIILPEGMSLKEAHDIGIFDQTICPHSFLI